MIGDGPVGEAEFFHVRGDLFERVVAVAPGRVIVQRAFQIGPFDQPGQRAFLAGREFAVVFAQFRRHEWQIKRGKDLRLVLARDEQFRVARFLLGFEQAVFVEPQAALNRALAHDDVVLLAAGEIGEREWKLRVAHHAQIALDAAFENHARLRVALGDDLEDAGLRDKILDHFDRLSSTRPAGQCRR